MIYSAIKYLIVLSLFTGIWERFHKIAVTNRIKSSAEQAYIKKDFKNAALLYDSLITFYNLRDEQIRLNLAHAYFKMEDRKKASINYKQLTTSSSTFIASVSDQQLGLIAAMKGKYDEAISLFKKALKTEPANEKARYNLELIIKLKNLESEAAQKAGKKGKGSEKGAGGRGKGSRPTEEIKGKISESGMNTAHQGTEHNQGDLSEDSESGEGSKNETEGGDKEDNSELKKDNKGNKDEEAMKSRRLSEIKISEEKARLILEEMKEEEIQYLLQLKKHQVNKEYKGKPEW